MNFSALVEEGIKKIYTEDRDMQEHYLDIFAKDVRKLKDASIFFKAEAFFVPNNDYMVKYFGQEALNPSYDMYNYDGECVWDNQIVFPIRNVVEKPVGFVGFNPFIKLQRSDENMRTNENYYRYSTSQVFNRGRHLYCPRGVYDKAVRDGYIVLTDGVYDMWGFNEHGINSGCLMGSTISEELLFILRFVDTLFLAQDDDDAGLRVLHELKRHHPNVRYLRHNAGKDADDILKSDKSETYVEAVRKAISTKTDLVLRFKPKM